MGKEKQARRRLLGNTVTKVDVRGFSKGVDKKGQTLAMLKIK